MKKINNYHLSLLLVIVFILNTILFQSIKITQGQFKQPTQLPGAGVGASIVTSPLSASLELGGFDIFGDGNIEIDGSAYFSGPIGIGINEQLDGYLHIKDGGETGGALLRGSSQGGNTVFYVNSTADGDSYSGEIETRRYDGQRTLISSYRDSYFMGGKVEVDISTYYDNGVYDAGDLTWKLLIVD